jgi:ketose-bisphosphate aldolase
VAELLASARAEGYALGYFESWNIESLQGVIDAAEQTRSPVVIGFNGEFLTHPARGSEERIDLYGALGRAAAESATVPCGLLFNECPSEGHTRRAVDAGFNLVMLATTGGSFEEYSQSVASLVRLAHPRGVAVEAEIGQLPTGSGGDHVPEGGMLTDPALAARFVAATGVDVLCVSVGNVHVLLAGEQDLNLGHLAAIRENVDIPLALHGGTGITESSLREAIRLGVTKVAYGTYVKQRYLSAVRGALSGSEANPHKLLGIGGAEDVMVAGRLAVRDAILERIEWLGCCGRA